MSNNVTQQTVDNTKQPETKDSPVIDDEVKELEASTQGVQNLSAEVAQYLQPEFSESVLKSFASILQFSRE